MGLIRYYINPHSAPQNKVGQTPAEHTMLKSAVSDASSELLIELVRQHPILYDPTCPEHMDAQRMYTILHSFAKSMAKDHKMTGKSFGSLAPFAREQSSTLTGLPWSSLDFGKKD